MVWRLGLDLGTNSIGWAALELPPDGKEVTDLIDMGVCNRIVVTPGMLTGMLRGKWGWNGLLSDHNKKTREDHRHHALDALVVALTTRSLLRKINTLRGQDGRVHIDAPEPEIDAETVAAALARITVAFKPDHGLAGRMFKETAYGLVEHPDPDLPDHRLVTRKKILELKATELGAIADTRLRAALAAFAAAPENRDRKLPQVLADFAKAEHAAALEAWAAKGKDPATAPQPIRHLRLLVTNQTAAPVASAPYKAYTPDAYVFCDIWRVPAGRAGRYKAGAFKWTGTFRSAADVAHPPADANTLKPHPAARRVMRLFKNDMVEMTEDDQRQVMRVGSFSTTDNRIDLRPHRVANATQRFISINVLKDWGLRKLHVTPDGRIEQPRGRSDP